MNERWLLLVGLAVLVAGCAADRFANPSYRGCTTNGECGADQRCVSGFCVDVEGMDAGHDGGRDGGRDADVEDDAGTDGGTDGGSGCPVDDVCYEGAESTRGVGVCAPGCTEEGSCVGQVLPGDEECNGADDDCDMNVDEGFTPFDTEERCGACDTSCAPGETCCETLDLSGVECANTSSSLFHCGACRNSCAAGQACCGSSCASIASDENNCGACGNMCDAGQECCDGRCVDTSSSLAHCGSCGSACTGTDVCCPAMAPPNPTGCRPDTECLSCMPACTGGQTCCGGACIDDQTDEANCGMCGNACAAGELCCGGACTPPDDACGSCTNDCSASEQCCGGSCVSRTSTSTCGSCEVSCAPGQACCASGCANTNTDPANCGMCGTTCVGEICSNGHCCPPGQTWCGDATGCVPLNTNMNCGSCGNSCTGFGCNCTATGGGFACRALGLAC